MRLILKYKPTIWRNKHHQYAVDGDNLPKKTLYSDYFVSY